MLICSVRAEITKLHRSYVWLALIIMPLMSAFFGTFNYMNNLEILTEQWYSLWTQHALFYGALFAPSLIGVFCAYICRLEHLNHNWNTVMTQPISVTTIIVSKLVVVSILAAITQMLIGILYVASGKIAGLTNPIPAELLFWLTRGWWSLTVEASLLLSVAMIIRSFAVPVALGILGGFCGIAALVKGFGVLFPFSLLPLAMCSNHPSEPMECSVSSFYISSMIYLILGLTTSILWMKKCDVRTS